MRKIVKLFCFSLIIFLVACTPETKDDKIQDIVDKVWDEEIYFPIDEEYPIGLIYTEYFPILKDGKYVRDGEEPWLINIMYFSQNETSQNGNEHIDNWKENDPLKEFIYEDSYKNKIMISIAIQKRESIDFHPFSEEKEIDGHKIYYFVDQARDEGEYAYIGINFDNLDYGYTLLHKIDENNTEDDALAFAKEIIKNNKK